MWPSQRTVWGDQGGIVLVMVLMIVSMLSVLALAFSTLVGTDVLSRAGSAQMREGFYAAEAGLNIGMTRFTPFFANGRVPSGSDFAEQTATVGTRTVYYHLSPTAVTGSCSEVENPNCYITIAAGEKFAGVKSIPSRYSVDSTSENSEGDEETYLGAQFEVHTIPLFQFLAFYAGDLELSPDATMNLHGRLHTN